MVQKNPTKPFKEGATGLEGLGRMNNRLNVYGGQNQQNRMIREKNWTLQHAIKYSYEGARVKKIGENSVAPALISPDKTKQNYDDKIISTGYEFGFKPGDVFEWLNTGTKWIVTLQELTELAYFKSSIRRCNYSISWKDKETGEVFNTFAAIRGPVETAITFIQKQNISVDQPNHSLEILMPKNKESLSYFRRYAKFYLQGIEEGDKDTCWRVEATDSISMPGILQIVADEYYANDQTDSDKIAGNLVAHPLRPEEDAGNFIQGPTVIKPRVVVEYSWKGRDLPNWSWDERLPIQAQMSGRTIKLVWTSTYRGTIELMCNDRSKMITVSSVF